MYSSNNKSYSSSRNLKQDEDSEEEETSSLEHDNTENDDSSDEATEDESSDDEPTPKQRLVVLRDTSLHRDSQQPRTLTGNITTITPSMPMPEFTINKDVKHFIHDMKSRIPQPIVRKTTS